MPISNLWISWDVELIFVLSFIFSPIFIEEKLGRGFVFMLFGIVFAGDTGALIGGKLIGKLKLAPKISPNKTVEGALIGLACAFIVGVLIKIIIDIKIPFNSFMLLIVLLNIAGVVGDLNESWIKRVAKQKDASKILGAHGGVIDRIDGVMPVFLTVCLLLFFHSSLVS
jgi:phosphatidate cytidylyltransferase